MGEGIADAEAAAPSGVGTGGALEGLNADGEAGGMTGGAAAALAVAGRTRNTPVSRSPLDRKLTWIGPPGWYRWDSAWSCAEATSSSVSMSENPVSRSKSVGASSMVNRLGTKVRP